MLATPSSGTVRTITSQPIVVDFAPFFDSDGDYIDEAIGFLAAHNPDLMAEGEADLVLALTPKGRGVVVTAEDPKLVTIEHAVDFLNNLLLADPEVVNALARSRVDAGLLAHHDTVTTIATGPGGALQVGLLGILNGLFACEDKIISMAVNMDTDRIARFEVAPAANFREDPDEDSTLEAGQPGAQDHPGPASLREAD